MHVSFDPALLRQQWISFTQKDPEAQAPKQLVPGHVTNEVRAGPVPLVLLHFSLAFTGGKYIPLKITE